MKGIVPKFYCVQVGPSGEKMYSGMFDCFKKTYKAEGYFGMYRGSAGQSVGQSVSQSVSE